MPGAVRRARRGIDVGRLGKAVERPGIDPRVWLAIGTVTELGFDQTEGAFADVAIQPEGNVETCYVGVPYAGSAGGMGFGDWCPLEVDDTVLVAVPSGDTNNGPLIVARFWNRGDPPPSQIAGAEPDANRWIIAKPGQSVNVLATLLGLLATGGTQMSAGPASFAVTSQAAPGVVGTLSVTPEGCKLETSLPLVPVTLGDDGATPLAHSIETVAAFTALLSALTTIAANIDAEFVMSPGGNPTWTDMQNFIGIPLTAAVAAAAATLPTLPCTKVRGT